jgi:hypothetical protein
MKQARRRTVSPHLCYVAVVASAILATASLATAQNGIVITDTILIQQVHLPLEYQLPEPTDLGPELLQLTIADAQWTLQQEYQLLAPDSQPPLQTVISDKIQLLNDGPGGTSRIYFGSDGDNGLLPQMPPSPPIVTPIVAESIIGVPATLLVAGVPRPVLLDFFSDSEQGVVLPAGISDIVRIRDTPEPGTLTLLGIAALSLIFCGGRRRC